MKRSTDRILTTHTGSLPRPKDLAQMIFDREEGRSVDERAFESRAAAAVSDIVQKQVQMGIDIVNDGEQGKIGYSTYVKDRLSGFEGEGSFPPMIDLAGFPEYAQRLGGELSQAHMTTPACNGPIQLKDRAAVHKDIAAFQQARAQAAAADYFMTAASPGVIALFLQNQYYPSHEAYLYAIADAMKEEYKAIADAGFVLQVDCPDLAVGRHTQFVDQSLEEFRKTVQLHMEALDYAVAGIPPEQLRMHLCWGNYAGPHTMDVGLGDIIDLVLRGRPTAVSFEAANPRHQHEWKVFQTVKLPAGKTIIPGVIDSTTNYVEHPEVVADRLVRFGQLVGKENVIAGSDCGFATFAGHSPVDPNAVWAKFQSMGEGARLASAELA